jgi:disulfide bond formation protein DsbB
MIRSDKLQRIAEIVMVLGIIALCQPWNLFLHRYGLTIIIVGLLTFMFTGWFGSKGDATAANADDAVFDVSDHREGRP